MALTESGQPAETEAWSVPDDDYFDDELPGRPLRKRAGPVTFVLLGVALAAGAFYAGVTVEKHNVTATSTSSTGGAAGAAFRARGLGGTRTGGTTGGATGATGSFGGATGTITLIDGSTVYVTQTDGTIVKVSTSPGSQIAVTSTGTVANLHPGDNVTVVGPSDGNGGMTATSLTDNGAGGAGGGGAARRAAGAGAAATPSGAAATPGG